MDAEAFVKKWAMYNREEMLKDLRAVVSVAVIDAVLKGRAAEREACAKMAESFENNLLAKAIRAQK